jgi:hypothetical protein
MSRSTGAGKTWERQCFVSEPRPFREYGPSHVIIAELRFDDCYKNGQNGFTITATIGRPHARDVEASGCLHNEIAKAFPEFRHLIKWHGIDTRGPNVSNVLYFAGDKDHYGLAKGESKPIMAADGIPHWNLEAVDGSHSVPIYSVNSSFKGEIPPAVPQFKWVQLCRIGEGKERQLDLARQEAVWQDATDAELSVSKAELQDALAARLPALLERFRNEVTSAGFNWAI